MLFDEVRAVVDNVLEQGLELRKFILSENVSVHLSVDDLNECGLGALSDQCLCLFFYKALHARRIVFWRQLGNCFVASARHAYRVLGGCWKPCTWTLARELVELASAPLLAPLAISLSGSS